MRKINKDSDTKFSKFKHVKITNEKRLFANRDGEIVIIHTHASFYRHTSDCGVNDNRFCTQNAKGQAFWRMIPVTGSRRLNCYNSNVKYTGID